ncbi:MAG: UDP-N-acetylglucosamine diphosphorylase/glucosamine-1-phosphate N-acetyltransferase, partial [Halorubrum sp. J07HR59]
MMRRPVRLTTCKPALVVSERMYGVVLAAGRGTRMRPLTDYRPKPLLPVGQSTLLEQVFEAAFGVVDEFVVVIGYRGSAIQDAVGETYRGRPVTYVTQENPQGTAHAVAQADPIVDDDFLVLNGDVLVDTSLPEALAESDGTAIAATEVANPQAYGVISTSADGGLSRIVEKPADPPTDFANVGCYAFEPSVFEYIDRTSESDRGEYEITTTLELLLDAGNRIDVTAYQGTWLDVGRPWELLAANESVLESKDESEYQLDGTVENGVELRGQVAVKAGAHIRSGAYIEGPTVIRRGAEVGPNAY